MYLSQFLIAHVNTNINTDRAYSNVMINEHVEIFAILCKHFYHHH